MLLTDFPPETAGGGAVILQSLLDPAELEKNFLWLTPSRPRAEGRNVVWLRRGSAARTPKLGRSLWLDNTLMAGDLADEVLEIARERGARAIWIVMHGAGVAIAARLSSRTTIPIHLTVHDDPAFAIALASRRYLALVPAIERDFARALRAAASVDVTSEGMAERYLRRYGIRSVIVHRGMDRVVEPSPPYDKQRWGLRVGILGNTYGYRQLLILGQAVAEAARKLGVPGRLLVIGAGYGERLSRDLAGRVEVEFTGHIDEPAAVRHLQRCFLLYLNYPFPNIHAVRRQTSFPTKLSTYVQAARPILIHAPADSSVTSLGAMTGYAHCWGTPNERFRRLRSSRGSGLIRIVQRASKSTSTACAPATSTSRRIARLYSMPSTRSSDLRSPNMLPSRTDIDLRSGRDSILARADAIVIAQRIRHAMASEQVRREHTVMTTAFQKVRGGARILLSAELWGIALGEVQRARKPLPEPPRANLVEEDPAAGMYAAEIGGYRYWLPMDTDRSGLSMLHPEVFCELHPHYYEYANCRVSPKATVVDAGASEGFFTRFVHWSERASVLAMQPWAPMADCLRRTYADEISSSRVTIEQAALAAEEGEGSLYIDPKQPWGLI